MKQRILIFLVLLVTVVACGANPKTIIKGSAQDVLMASTSWCLPVAGPGFNELRRLTLKRNRTAIVENVRFEAGKTFVSPNPSDLHWSKTLTNHQTIKVSMVPYKMSSHAPALRHHRISEAFTPPEQVLTVSEDDSTTSTGYGTKTSTYYPCSSYFKNGEAVPVQETQDSYHLSHSFLKMKVEENQTLPKLSGPYLSEDFAGAGNVNWCSVQGSQDPASMMVKIVKTTDHQLYYGSYTIPAPAGAAVSFNRVEDSAAFAVKDFSPDSYQLFRAEGGEVMMVRASRYDLLSALSSSDVYLDCEKLLTQKFVERNFHRTVDVDFFSKLVEFNLKKISSEPGAFRKE
ncbi:MAG TPA: hypothetical protein VNJ01_12095 [Bacteriovoracaceae bacterium]|nr:hypothetical protein [Bacteriovoracaceae bacterium]